MYLWKRLFNHTYIHACIHTLNPAGITHHFRFLERIRLNMETIQIA